MKPLKKEFIGIGEVKGYLFRQISVTKSGFLYEVSSGKGKHYEVFKKVVNRRFACISYPTSKAFGIWAWTFTSLDKAIEKLNAIKNPEVEQV